MIARPSALASLTLAAALARAPLAAAQDAGAPPAATTLLPGDEDARRLFAQALTLLNEQRFAEAAPLLERSVALREHPAALAALAASYRGLGRYLRAIATLERLVATGHDAAQEAEARGVLAECRRALSRVTLRVTGEPTEVLVDGDRVDAGDVRRELTLDPGLHRFEVRRMGYEPVREERRLGVGEASEVALDASARPMPATLVIETPQATTTIRVDGVPVGRGRHAMATASGRHAIVVTWDDGHAQERVVELAPGARMTVSIAADRAPGITARWWFWAGSSAVVAGLIVGGYFLFRPVDTLPQGSWANVSEAISVR